MMPLQLSPVDVRVVSSRRQPARQLADPDGDNARLAAEVRRLEQENQDLRDAANLWIRLYERQLARANEAVQQADIHRRK